MRRGVSVIALATTLFIPIGAASVSAAAPGNRPADAVPTTKTSDEVLARAAHTLTSHAAQLRDAGVELRKVAVDHVHGVLDIGVTPESRQNSAAILQRWTPDVTISLSRLRVHAAAGVSAYAPGPPWQGGMELYSTFYRGGRLYYRECTAGFNVVSPSTRRTYVTTAGHCFEPGSVVKHSVRYRGQRVGVVTRRAGYGSSADTELIPVSSRTVRNTVIIGRRQLTVSAYRPITPVGTSVCKSGITTGVTCGNVVRDSSVTVCYPGHGCVSGQEQTYNRNRARVASYGDSGGPVYTYGANGTVIASGMVSGFEERCNSSGCYFDGVMYFTPIKNIQDELGVIP